MHALSALFAEGRYIEAATLAQTITTRFPFYGVGWKAWGVALRQIGRRADALASLQNAASLLPRDAEAHSNLGAVLQDLGRLDEAIASYRQALQIEPDFLEVHYNLGNALHELGRLDEAEASYRWVIQAEPNFAEAYSNLGGTLHDMGRLEDAEASFRRALHIAPDLAEIHNNLGNTLKDLNRLAEAEASYNRALQIKPDYAEALGNLGNTLQDLARPGEAEISYRRALQIKPDYVEALSNLGCTLQELGRPDEAEASYKRALQIKPDHAGALNNLALLFNAQGKASMALNTIKQSLQTKETEEAKSIFVACVKRLRFTQDSSEIRTLMVRALTEPWGRPSELAPVSIGLVKLNPDIGEWVARAVDGWPVRLPAQVLFGAHGLATLSANSLLCALLDSALICDIEMERFLAMGRHALLVAATTTVSDSEVSAALSFYSALARQCFINEYVFSHTADEIQNAGALRNSLVAALEAKTQVPVLWPVAVAAYFPLYSVPLAARLLDTEWPAPVTAVLTQQICEPAEELQLAATIPALTNIDDGVSLLVQHQYEENPYPRWTKMEPVGKAKNIVEYLCQKFPLAPIQSHDQIHDKRHGKSNALDILIAGCGTGQHSISTAQRFPEAQVLAIDLSMSSLSYAKRKTHELGLTSIEYAQADLLKLGSLGRSFDLIESVGVLHHLANPWAGWQVLLSLLRPGGFMRLGFYSEIARRNIVRVRDFIARQGYGATADEIRRCREDLIALDETADFGTTLKSSDFFSVSNCRDLLIHVQEHRMTLTSIEAFLRENNLAFLGFEIEGDVLHNYKQRFPDDRTATHLGQWQIFENENPDIFFGMYQFWVQKIPRREIS